MQIGDPYSYAAENSTFHINYLIKLGDDKIKDFDQLYLRHVLHSLSIAKVCPFAPGARVLDVGCGGGFPSVPLAILLPRGAFHGRGLDRQENQGRTGRCGGTRPRQPHPPLRPGRNASRTVRLCRFRAVTEDADLRRLGSGIESEPGAKGALPNGILYLKGGDLAEELAPNRQTVAYL